MGIKFYCPNGHKLNVKSFLAGKRGVCPHCDARVDIPWESQIPSSRKSTAASAQGSSVSRGGSPAVSTIAPANTPSVDRASPLARTTGSDRVADPAAAGFSPAPLASPRAAGSESVAHSQPAFPAVPTGVPAAAASPAVEYPVPLPVAPAPSEAGDPIAEAPQAVWYVRPPSGGQFGPARGETMRKWMGEGRVTSDSLVWRDGWEDWREAGEVFADLPAPPGSGPSEQVPSLGSAETGFVAGASPFVVESTRSSSGTPAPRRRKSRAMAIVLIALLVLVSLGLLVTLVWVLSGGL